MKRLPVPRALSPSGLGSHRCEPELADNLITPAEASRLGSDQRKAPGAEPTSSINYRTVVCYTPVLSGFIEAVYGLEELKL